MDKGGTREEWGKERGNYGIIRGKRRENHVNKSIERPKISLNLHQ